jgi:small subunit ribosomal protein S17
MTEERSQRRSQQGLVVSNKMDKTVVVTIERTTRHGLYGKVLKRASKCKAHDEQNECNVGDVVRMEECRPLSREKHWRVVEVVSRAK